MDELAAFLDAKRIPHGKKIERIRNAPAKATRVELYRQKEESKRKQAEEERKIVKRAVPLRRAASLPGVFDR